MPPWQPQFHAPLQWRQVPVPAAPQAPAPAPAPPSASPSPAAPTRAAAAPASAPAAPSEALTLALPPSAVWHYALRFEDEVGEAELDWSQAEGAYTLTLRRQTQRRALPQWRSVGQAQAQGMVPAEFSAERARGTPLRLRFAEGQVHGARTHWPVPTGVQDRLSWMLQLPALLQARTQVQALELTVVDWRGRPQRWRFERLGLESLVLADGSTRAAWRWHRTPQGEAQAEIELWLAQDDAGAAPLRLLHRVRGDERWELLAHPPPPPLP